MTRLASIALALAFALCAARAQAQETVPSRHVPGGVRLWVLEPPSYRAHPERRYPTLYFLHDARGSERSLQQHRLDEELLAAMRGGSLPEALVVAPRGRGTWFVDGYDGRVRYAQFRAEELIPYVEARYRTLPERRARFVSGISMGGFGALRWGLLHPELFAAIGVLSPAVQQLTWRMVEVLPFFARPTVTGAFGPTRDRNSFRANDVYALLLARPELAATAPPVQVRCGESDAYRLADVTLYFDRFLAAVGARHDLVLEAGGHDWAYWRTAYPRLVASLLLHDAPQHGTAAEAR
jgi:S-formylglutathione hydrolase FrmB